jgi:uncharacterized protein (DUF1778 family)
MLDALTILDLEAAARSTAGRAPAIEPVALIGAHGVIKRRDIPQPADRAGAVIHVELYGIMPYMIEPKETPMPKHQIEAETARLEARVPVLVYDQMQRAARLRGMTLTGYLIATAGEDARRVVEDADIMRLAREDQIRFAEALINPPQPNARLARAAKRHAELIERR